MTSELHRKLWDDTDDQLRDAEAALLRLRSETDREQRRIEGLRKLQAALAPFVDDPVPTNLVVSDDSPRSAEVDSDTKPVRHADVARIVLEEAGRPLHTSDIISAMLANGHPLPTDPQQRKSAVYSAMLRRPAIFCRIGGGRWAIVRDEIRKVGIQEAEIQIPDLSGLGMPELATTAFEHLRRPATATELAEKLEELGFEHRKGKRATAASLHKALVRNPAKFRKVNDERGTWEPQHPNADPRLRVGESIENRDSSISDRENRDLD